MAGGGEQAAKQDDCQGMRQDNQQGSAGAALEQHWSSTANIHLGPAPASKPLVAARAPLALCCGLLGGSLGRRAIGLVVWLHAG